MAEMDDFDVEVQDEKDSNPEHFEGAVATAGSPVSISPSNGKDIQLVFIHNPNKGDNSNNFNDALYITLDGSANKTTIPRGASRYFPGIMSSIDVDSNNNGTNYEIIVWS